MTLVIDSDVYLEHYGIKGMRWGVRREVGSDGLVGGPQRYSGRGEERPRKVTVVNDRAGTKVKARTSLRSSQRYLNKVRTKADIKRRVDRSEKWNHRFDTTIATLMGGILTGVIVGTGPKNYSKEQRAKIEGKLTRRSNLYRDKLAANILTRASLDLPVIDYREKGNTQLNKFIQESLNTYGMMSLDQVDRARKQSKKSG